jgi:hypothetical protein
MTFLTLHINTLSHILVHVRRAAVKTVNHVLTAIISVQLPTHVFNHKHH